MLNLKKKLIEEQENDEVELDDFEPEDIEWHQIDLMEYLAQQKCCGNCNNEELEVHHSCEGSCGCCHDADGDRECCGKCNDKE